MAEITIRISDRLLKVGVALLVGICLVWALTYLGSSGFFRPKYRLKLYVEEATSLPIGAPIRVDGLDVGTVQAKNLAGKTATPQRRIELVLRVEKRDQEMIRSDSTATLATDGLLGKRFVQVERGFNGTPLNDGDEIASAPTMPKTVTGFLNSISKMADCLKEPNNQTNDSGHGPPATSPKR
jgi:phospholipid/cholesterol/gamma-HCH transport system substrate-binding protein